MQETFEFFATWKKEGFWVASTGKTFKESCIAFAEMLYEAIDYSLVAIMVLLLFAMFGSKRAVTYIYWTFASYIIIKIVGGAML